jgi:hypothetical protein
MLVTSLKEDASGKRLRSESGGTRRL